ncbi:hypothetical protein ILUMI_26831 [Ignelater luminosus]|uniref:HTH psq-type domain-containing protein n=1 Tax=Ignelater luminosus TaxID=2038154 RepID=A0A8K0C3G1_IGNLU|nr:hypothetical protein ILUMI_26831 [Ignelater luminosus]
MFLWAANQFQVPQTTLERYARKKRADSDYVVVKPLGRFTSVFSKNQEEVVVANLHKVEAQLFGLTIKALRTLAFQLAGRNVSHPFKNEVVGLDWVQKTFTDIVLPPASGMGVVSTPDKLTSSQSELQNSATHSAADAPSSPSLVSTLAAAIARPRTTSCSSFKTFSLENILPVRKVAQNNKQAKRKRGKTAILRYSPYKRKLAAADNNKIKQSVKKWLAFSGNNTKKVPSLNLKLLSIPRAKRATTFIVE